MLSQIFLQLKLSLTDSSTASGTVSVLSTIFVAPSFLILEIKVLAVFAASLNKITTGGF